MITLDRDFRSVGNGAADWHPGRLWSLWDMLRIHAWQYISLGESIHDTRAFFWSINDDPHRASYFEKRNLVSDAVGVAFPDVPGELREAANCLAVGFYTASVFHSMRAVELGMRAVAIALGVAFNFPIEQADWANIIDQMESKIRAMKNLPKSAAKEDDLKFYSETAMQFRYFKDAWRIRVSHARESYDEPQATSIMDHAIAFFEVIAARPLSAGP